MSVITGFLTSAGEPLVRARELLQLNFIFQVSVDQDYQWDQGDGLLDFDAKGAGSDQLSQNMSGLSHLLQDHPELLEKPYTITPEISTYLNEIADARGISPEQARQDYKRFLDLVNEHGINIETARGYGSESQLRFGFVVGEALEIDPAFASLMSPNGGFTGPGGKALDIDGDGLFEEIVSSQLPFSNEALSYHAPTHDAFGFLNKNFDIGPGYCYVPNGGDCILGDDNPLSGQLSGINYWDDKLDLNTADTIADARQEIGREFSETGRETWNEVKELKDEVGQEFTEAKREIGDEAREAVGEIWGEAREGNVPGTFAEIFEGGVETTGQVLEGGAEVVYQTGEGLAETVWQVGEGTFETGRELTEGTVELGNDIKDTIVGGGVPFVPGI